LKFYSPAFKLALQFLKTFFDSCQEFLFWNTSSFSSYTVFQFLQRMWIVDINITQVMTCWNHGIRGPQSASYPSFIRAVTEKIAVWTMVQSCMR
jgi:hypothetical protein